MLLGDEQRGTQWDTVPTLTGPVGYDGGRHRATVTYTGTEKPLWPEGRDPQAKVRVRVLGPDTTHATAFETEVEFPSGMAPRQCRHLHPAVPRPGPT
ncbi:hypothetical protein GCM10020229_69950 [Kitasatospora albolonga]|uniref:hypothetical protein n=1 Tax=Kitasatospora albolonga TaxID=68173 RepID=UPI0031E6253B